MTSNIEPVVANFTAVTGAVQERNSAATIRLGVAAMVLFAIAGWLLLHPYAGLAHDSALYSLLALVRQHPDTLTSDIFLRFGSQDRYTIFSPLYSGAIALFGLERAAALLTFVSQLAFFGCTWLLARRFATALTATLGVALLIVLPGEYGSATYFHYAEQFATPRMPAETLVMLSLLATLARRPITALLCVVAATLLHPIMAAAGAVMLILTFFAPARPRLTLAAGAALFVGSLIIIEAIAPFGRLDDVWLTPVREVSPFLYVSIWSAADWSRVGIPLAVLTIGMLNGSGKLLGKICAGALATAACGLVITFIYCDLLHVVIFTDLQAWRWLWLVNVIAIVLSPVILGDCWRSGLAGRTAVVLLVSAWVIRGGNSESFIYAACAIACAAVPAAWREHRHMRTLLWGACALLVISVANEIADRAYVPPASVDESSTSAALRQVTLWCADGVLPAALAIAFWLGVSQAKSLRVNAIFAAGAALLCGALVPLAGVSWLDHTYTPALRDKFAAWRAEIPPRAEVLWPATPVGAWYLLERPSYWSAYQAAGGIFSREKALIMRNRTKLISDEVDPPRPAAAHLAALVNSAVIPSSDATKLTPKSLAGICRDRDLSYVVSWLRLGPSPVAPVTPDPAKPNSQLSLYRCADFRS